MGQTPASRTIEPSPCAQQSQSSGDKYTERYKIIAEMYEIAIEIGSLEVDLVIRQYKFMELRKKLYVNLYGQQEKPSQTDEKTSGISQNVLGIFLFSLIWVTDSIDGYRILGLFLLPSKSHFNFNNAVMKSLATAGHDVVVVTPFTNEQPSLKHYSIIDFSHNMTFYINQHAINQFSEMSIYDFWDLATGLELQYCKKWIEHKEFQKMFRSEEKQFDVIFYEVWSLYECFAPLAAKWRIPMISTATYISWGPGDRLISNPRFPAVLPVEMGLPWKLNNIYERFRNTLSHIWNDFCWIYFIVLRGREFYNTYIHELGPHSEYRNIKPSLVFFNSHLSVLPRAQNPNAIEIGGIHVPEAKPLPSKIKKFIDDAEKGVILFTLGSVVKASTLSNETIEAFREAFRSIPQRVIWKYEDELENVPENVMLLSWIPQRDILAHDNLKVVISHCGMSGFYEIVHSGKPVITTPLFADQMTNANVLEKKGVSINLDIKSVNKEIILSALTAIVNDTRYASNMKRLSRTFKDRPMSPQETVVYWTKYVIEYEGATHLSTPASKLYWFQYLLIDILVCGLMVICSGVFLVRRIFYRVKGYRKCFGSRGVRNMNKKIS